MEIIKPPNKCQETLDFIILYYQKHVYNEINWNLSDIITRRRVIWTMRRISKRQSDCWTRHWHSLAIYVLHVDEMIKQ